MAEQNCEPLSPSKGCDSAGLNLQTTGNRLPKDSGGGHEFVTELPQNGVEGVEYVLMDDLTDPATYKGTYIFNKASGTFIASSSGGGSGGSVDTAMSDTSTNAVQNKVIKKYVDDTKSDVESLLEKKVFVAEYNVTTSAEIRAYIDAAEEPFAPILVKRGNDYYTAILATKSGDDAAIVRVIGSGSGEFYLFTYTVTGNSWANSSYGLQKKLVSGTDIKTINGESILGSGNIDIESATVFNAGTDYPYATMAAALDAGNVLIKDGSVNHPVVHFQDDSGEATLYVFVESGLQGSPSQVCYKWISGEYQEKTEKYIVPTNGTPGQVLTKKSTSIGDYGWADATGGGNANYSIDKANNIANFQNSEGQHLSFDFSEDDSLGVIAADPGTYYKKGKVGKFREYELSLEDVGGNVVPIGAITIDNVRYGLYEFFYKTGALPTANSTKVYSFANLLANYSVQNFIDTTGITSNGIFIGNGQTDNDNRVIVQQFSKNNKTITLRAYQDFSRETGTLKVQFIGTKNS